MSTPKEKAIKLFKEYLEWIGKSYYHDGAYSKGEEDKAKECALVTVEEMIKEYDAIESEQVALGFINSKMEYWNEVKEELNKL